MRVRAGGVGAAVLAAAFLAVPLLLSDSYFVHVMIGGRIVKSGGEELAHELEAKGYEGVRKELGIEDNGEAGA